MADVITYQRFRQRRDTAANWTSVNPVLASGEIGVELRTAPQPHRVKIGDGVTAWNSLAYFAANGSIGCTFHGQGAPITAGESCDVVLPFDCTIISATLVADQIGSVVIDVRVDDYANFPPTAADSIVASAPPTITADIKSQDATLTGWTTNLDRGQTVRFTVTSVTDIERVHLTLEVIK